MLFFFSFPLPSPFSLFPANHSNFFEDSAPSGGRPCRGNPRNGFRSSAIFYLGHPRGWTEGGREGGRRRVSGGWTGTPFMPRRYYVCTWHANTSVLGQFTVILTVAICSSLSSHPPSPTPPFPTTSEFDWWNQKTWIWLRGFSFTSSSSSSSSRFASAKVNAGPSCLAFGISAVCSNESITDGNARDCNPL